MMFRVTLTDLGNVADLEAHKRKRRRPRDEVFVRVTGGAEPKVEFEEPDPRPPIPKQS